MWKLILESSTLQRMQREKVAARDSLIAKRVMAATEALHQTNQDASNRLRLAAVQLSHNATKFRHFQQAAVDACAFDPSSCDAGVDVEFC